MCWVGSGAGASAAADYGDDGGLTGAGYHAAVIGHRRWDAWFLVCALGLLPLGLWYVVRTAVTGRTSGVTAQASREFLYFALSTSAMALVTLLDAPPSRRQQWLRRTLFYACLGVVIAAAALYSAILTSEDLHEALYGMTMYHFSQSAALCALVIAGLVHVNYSDGD
jgi:hypothetical protein